MQKNSDYQKLGDKLLAEISDGNSRDDLFFKIACFYSDDEAHAMRMNSYFKERKFCPSTPIIANIPENGKPFRGLPISCFVSEANKNNVDKILTETIHLSKAGGGLGTLWNDFPSIYDRGTNDRNSFGIIPFAKLQGTAMRLMAGFSRKVGSLAVFLSVYNPDILNFIRMRKNAQGIDAEQAIPRYIHHAVVIPDEFMHSVIKNQDWFMYNQKGEIVNKIKARELFIEILTIRTETGEPYIIFSDNMNKGLSEHHKQLNLKINTSNLCTEIALITGKDHLDIERTAICCLGSMNLAKFDELENNDQFFEDIARFMDNILTFFIVEAPNLKLGQIIHYNEQFGLCNRLRSQEKESVENAFKFKYPLASAVYSARRSRDIGIGIAGWHTFLQQRNIPFESIDAQKLNKTIFNTIKNKFDQISKKLAEERGACEDAKDCGIMERFSYKTAIAPTTQIAPILGVSKSIEPDDPVFLSKNQAGFHLMKNPILEEYFETKSINNYDLWMDIASQGLENIVSDDIFQVFKGPADIDPLQMIQQAAERPIDQSQSLTLFFKTPIDLNMLINVHMQAWKLGIKALYYLRSTEKISASKSIFEGFQTMKKQEECLACQ